MFGHFFSLILPIFVSQTPKYSVVCFETDCAYDNIPPSAQSGKFYWNECLGV